MFQAALTDTGGGDFDTEIIYGDIQRSQGTGSATNNGIAGITDGGFYIEQFVGSSNKTELLNYETNEFRGGDANGTFAAPPIHGFPRRVWR